VVCAVVVGVNRWPISTTYTTRFGEVRSIKLADGSILNLDTNSEVRVEYTNKARNVWLINGQARFVVQADPSKPFRVGIDRVLVEVLGTEFDVYKQTARMTVSVLAGEVSVLLSTGKDPPADLDRQQYAPPPGVPNDSRLSAGRQVRITPNGTFRQIENPDIAAVRSWTQRRFRFNRTPLAEAAEEYNRYNAVPIVVEGEDLRARLVDGSFSVDRPDSLIEDLQSKDDRITVIREGNRTVLRWGLRGL
jgi:transmembrane sensor